VASAFRIIELDAQGKETGVRFDWDSVTQTSPRGAWEYALKLRTSREDYTGAGDKGLSPVTEQILGPVLEPFTLEGVWKNRWAGDGFADATRQAFEALIMRGNRVSIAIDNLKFDGLITDLVITYRRTWEIGYRFTVSPHTFNTARDAAPLRPRQLENPSDTYAEAARFVAAIQAAQAAMPRTQLSGALYTDAAAQIAAINVSLAAVEAVVADRVLTVSDSGNGLDRLAQSFVALRDAAALLPPLFAASSSSTAIAYQATLAELRYETWKRTLAFYARSLMNLCHEAAEEYRIRVDGAFQALYWPRYGESLYGIALRFYGTTERWRDIFHVNALTTFVLDGTQVLYIPT